MVSPFPILFLMHKNIMSAVAHINPRSLLNTISEILGKEKFRGVFPNRCVNLITRFLSNHILQHCSDKSLKNIEIKIIATFAY